MSYLSEWCFPPLAPALLVLILSSMPYTVPFVCSPLPWAKFQGKNGLNSVFFKPLESSGVFVRRIEVNNRVLVQAASIPQMIMSLPKMQHLLACCCPASASLRTTASSCFLCFSSHSRFWYMVSAILLGKIFIKNTPESSPSHWLPLRNIGFLNT